MIDGYPLHIFNFLVELTLADNGSAPPVCSGAFSDCTGLEATMEPRVIKEGGRNFGAIQRVGPVTFATIVLKRGMTTNADLWKWFEMVSGGDKYAVRLSGTIKVFGPGGAAAGRPVMVWKLTRALPVKFKAADLNARGSEVGVEELHLAHEGLKLVPQPAPAGGRTGGRR